MTENEQILAEEQTIIQRLLAGGWLKTEGAQVLGTADMLYTNGLIELQVQHVYGAHELIILITTADGLELTLFADYGERLEGLLDAIVASQDEITIKNFRDHVRRWLAACPDIYIQEDEDSEPLLLTSD